MKVWQRYKVIVKTFNAKFIIVKYHFLVTKASSISQIYFGAVALVNLLYDLVIDYSKA